MVDLWSFKIKRLNLELLEEGRLVKQSIVLHFLAQQPPLTCLQLEVLQVAGALVLCYLSTVYSSQPFTTSLSHIKSKLAWQFVDQIARASMMSTAHACPHRSPAIVHRLMSKSKGQILIRCLPSLG